MKKVMLTVSAMMIAAFIFAQTSTTTPAQTAPAKKTDKTVMKADKKADKPAKAKKATKANNTDKKAITK